jgi:hypothetical protein
VPGQFGLNQNPPSQYPPATPVPAGTQSLKSMPTNPAGAPNYQPMNIYASATVKDFVAACKIDKSSCINEVGSALMDKMVLDGNSSICIDQVNYGAAVPDWLAAHPQTAAMKTGDGIYAALRALYPC